MFTILIKPSPKNDKALLCTERNPGNTGVLFVHFVVLSARVMPSTAGSSKKIHKRSLPTAPLVTTHPANSDDLLLSFRILGLKVLPERRRDIFGDQLLIDLCSSIYPTVASMMDAENSRPNDTHLLTQNIIHTCILGPYSGLYSVMTSHRDSPTDHAPNKSISYRRFVYLLDRSIESLNIQIAQTSSSGQFIPQISQTQPIVHDSVPPLENTTPKISFIPLSRPNGFRTVLFSKKGTPMHQNHRRRNSYEFSASCPPLSRSKMKNRDRSTFTNLPPPKAATSCSLLLHTVTESIPPDMIEGIVEYIKSARESLPEGMNIPSLLHLLSLLSMSLTMAEYSVLFLDAGVLPVLLSGAVSASPLVQYYSLLCVHSISANYAGVLLHTPLLDALVTILQHSHIVEVLDEVISILKDLIEPNTVVGAALHFLVPILVNILISALYNLLPPDMSSSIADILPTSTFSYEASHPRTAPTTHLISFLSTTFLPSSLYLLASNVMSFLAELLQQGPCARQFFLHNGHLALLTYLYSFSLPVSTLSTPFFGTPYADSSLCSQIRSTLFAAFSYYVPVPPFPRAVHVSSSPAQTAESAISYPQLASPSFLLTSSNFSFWHNSSLTSTFFTYNGIGGSDVENVRLFEQEIGSLITETVRIQEKEVAHRKQLLKQHQTGEELTPNIKIVTLSENDIHIGTDFPIHEPFDEETEARLLYAFPHSLHHLLGIVRSPEYVSTSRIDNTELGIASALFTSPGLPQIPYHSVSHRRGRNLKRPTKRMRSASSSPTVRRTRTFVQSISGTTDPPHSYRNSSFSQRACLSTSLPPSLFFNSNQPYFLSKDWDEATIMILMSPLTLIHISLLFHSNSPATAHFGLLLLLQLLHLSSSTAASSITHSPLSFGKIISEPLKSSEMTRHQAAVSSLTNTQHSLHSTPSNTPDLTSPTYMSRSSIFEQISVLLSAQQIAIPQAFPPLTSLSYIKPTIVPFTNSPIQPFDPITGRGLDKPTLEEHAKTVEFDQAFNQILKTTPSFASSFPFCLPVLPDDGFDFFADVVRESASVWDWKPETSIKQRRNRKLRERQEWNRNRRVTTTSQTSSSTETEVPQASEIRPDRFPTFGVDLDYSWRTTIKKTENTLLCNSYWASLRCATDQRREEQKHTEEWKAQTRQSTLISDLLTPPDTAGNVTAEWKCVHCRSSERNVASWMCSLKETPGKHNRNAASLVNAMVPPQYASSSKYAKTAALTPYSLCERCGRDLRTGDEWDDTFQHFSRRTTLSLKGMWNQPIEEKPTNTDPPVDSADTPLPDLMMDSPQATQLISQMKEAEDSEYQQVMNLLLQKMPNVESSINGFRNQNREKKKRDNEEKKRLKERKKAKLRQEMEDPSEIAEDPSFHGPFLHFRPSKTFYAKFALNLLYLPYSVLMSLFRAILENNGEISEDKERVRLEEDSVWFEEVRSHVSAELNEKKKQKEEKKESQKNSKRKNPIIVSETLLSDTADQPPKELEHEEEKLPDTKQEVHDNKAEDDEDCFPLDDARRYSLFTKDSARETFMTTSRNHYFMPDEINMIEEVVELLAKEKSVSGWVKLSPPPSQEERRLEEKPRSALSVVLGIGSGRSLYEMFAKDSMNNTITSVSHGGDQKYVNTPRKNHNQPNSVGFIHPMFVVSTFASNLESFSHLDQLNTLIGTNLPLLRTLRYPSLMFFHKDEEKDQQNQIPTSPGNGSESTSDTYVQYSSETFGYCTCGDYCGTNLACSRTNTLRPFEKYTPIDIDGAVTILHFLGIPELKVQMLTAGDVVRGVLDILFHFSCIRKCHWEDDVEIDVIEEQTPRVSTKKTGKNKKRVIEEVAQKKKISDYNGLEVFQYCRLPQTLNKHPDDQFHKAIEKYMGMIEPYLSHDGDPQSIRQSIRNSQKGQSDRDKKDEPPHCYFDHSILPSEHSKVMLGMQSNVEFLMQVYIATSFFVLTFTHPSSQAYLVPQNYIRILNLMCVIACHAGDSLSGLAMDYRQTPAYTMSLVHSATLLGESMEKAKHKDGSRDYTTAKPRMNLSPQVESRIQQRVCNCHSPIAVIQNGQYPSIRRHITHSLFFHAQNLNINLKPSTECSCLTLSDNGKPTSSESSKESEHSDEEEEEDVDKDSFVMSNEECSDFLMGMSLFGDPPSIYSDWRLGVQRTKRMYDDVEDEREIELLEDDLNRPESLQPEHRKRQNETTDKKKKREHVNNTLHTLPRADNDLDFAEVYLCSDKFILHEISEDTLAHSRVFDVTSTTFLVPLIPLPITSHAIAHGIMSTLVEMVQSAEFSPKFTALHTFYDLQLPFQNDGSEELSSHLSIPSMSHWSYLPHPLRETPPPPKNPLYQHQHLQTVGSLSLSDPAQTESLVLPKSYPLSIEQTQIVVNGHSSLIIILRQILPQLLSTLFASPSTNIAGLTTQLLMTVMLDSYDTSPMPTSVITNLVSSLFDQGTLTQQGANLIRSLATTLSSAVFLPPSVSSHLHLSVCREHGCLAPTLPILPPFLLHQQSLSTLLPLAFRLTRSLLRMNDWTDSTLSSFFLEPHNPLNNLQTAGEELSAIRDLYSLFSKFRLNQIPLIIHLKSMNSALAQFGKGNPALNESAPDDAAATEKLCNQLLDSLSLPQSIVVTTDSILAALSQQFLVLQMVTSLNSLSVSFTASLMFSFPFMRAITDVIGYVNSAQYELLISPRLTDFQLPFSGQILSAKKPDTQIVLFPFSFPLGHAILIQDSLPATLIALAALHTLNSLAATACAVSQQHLSLISQTPSSLFCLPSNSNIIPQPSRCDQSPFNTLTYTTTHLFLSYSAFAAKSANVSLFAVANPQTSLFQFAETPKLTENLFSPSDLFPPLNESTPQPTPSTAPYFSAFPSSKEKCDLTVQHFNLPTAFINPPCPFISLPGHSMFMSQLAFKSFAPTQQATSAGCSISEALISTLLDLVSSKVMFLCIPALMLLYSLSTLSPVFARTAVKQDAIPDLLVLVADITKYLRAYSSFSDELVPISLDVRIPGFTPSVFTLYTINHLPQKGDAEGVAPQVSYHGDPSTLAHILLVAINTIIVILPYATFNQMRGYTSNMIGVASLLSFLSKNSLFNLIPDTVHHQQRDQSNEYQSQVHSISVPTFMASSYTHSAHRIHDETKSTSVHPIQLLASPAPFRKTTVTMTDLLHSCFVLISETMMLLPRASRLSFFFASLSLSTLPSQNDQIPPPPTEPPQTITTVTNQKQKKKKPTMVQEAVSLCDLACSMLNSSQPLLIKRDALVLLLFGTDAFADAHTLAEFVKVHPVVVSALIKHIISALLAFLQTPDQNKSDLCVFVLLILANCLLYSLYTNAIDSVALFPPNGTPAEGAVSSIFSDTSLIRLIFSAAKKATQDDARGGGGVLCCVFAFGNDEQMQLLANDGALKTLIAYCRIILTEYEMERSDSFSSKSTTKDHVLERFVEKKRDLAMRKVQQKSEDDPDMLITPPTQPSIGSTHNSIFNPLLTTEECGSLWQYEVPHDCPVTSRSHALSPQKDGRDNFKRLPLSQPNRLLLLFTLLGLQRAVEHRIVKGDGVCDLFGISKEARNNPGPITKLLTPTSVFSSLMSTRVIWKNEIAAKTEPSVCDQPMDVTNEMLLTATDGLLAAVQNEIVREKRKTSEKQKEKEKARKAREEKQKEEEEVLRKREEKKKEKEEEKKRQKREKRHLNKQRKLEEEKMREEEEQKRSSEEVLMTIEDQLGHAMQVEDLAKWKKQEEERRKREIAERARKEEEARRMMKEEDVMAEKVMAMVLEEERVEKIRRQKEEEQRKKQEEKERQIKLEEELRMKREKERLQKEEEEKRKKEEETRLLNQQEEIQPKHEETEERTQENQPLLPQNPLHHPKHSNTNKTKTDSETKPSDTLHTPRHSVLRTSPTTPLNNNHTLFNPPDPSSSPFFGHPPNWMPGVGHVKEDGGEDEDSIVFGHENEESHNKHHSTFGVADTLSPFSVPPFSIDHSRLSPSFDMFDPSPFGVTNFYNDPFIHPAPIRTESPAPTQPALLFSSPPQHSEHQSSGPLSNSPPFLHTPRFISPTSPPSHCASPPLNLNSPPLSISPEQENMYQLLASDEKTQEQNEERSTVTSPTPRRRRKVQEKMTLSEFVQRNEPEQPQTETEYKNMFKNVNVSAIKPFVPLSSSKEKSLDSQSALRDQEKEGKKKRRKERKTKPKPTTQEPIRSKPPSTDDTVTVTTEEPILNDTLITQEARMNWCLTDFIGTLFDKVYRHEISPQTASDLLLPFQPIMTPTHFTQQHASVAHSQTINQQLQASYLLSHRQHHPHSQEPQHQPHTPLDQPKRPTSNGQTTGPQSPPFRGNQSPPSS
ncbi:Golgi Complex-Associated Protein of 60A [Blattamonas nauphoetae]|uniref:Golgi Complex-Associated Protein of 60A n=1 Tax=Blattamonas nauphoetae TaxID=2049346 RepID=A0ABQ9XI97_9EUKA|nr:Golgi Complex-Associated Protein of 60A [Blattamonas nauphoetae]